MVRRVGLVANLRYPDLGNVLSEMIANIDRLGWTICADAEVGELLGRTVDPIDLDQVDLILSLGGDGTMLGVARRLKGRPVPVLGINFGRVGFLTAVSRHNASIAIDRYAAGEFTVSRRATLLGSVIRNGEPVETISSLNDVVLRRGGLARVVRFEVMIDGESVGPVSADGVVIASPTGSTAYSLSAGGPVVVPNLAAMLVTPICAHSLGVRPLVVHGGSVITVKPVDPSYRDLMVSFDGQENVNLQSGDSLEIRIGIDRVLLVRFPKFGFFARLHEKLRWGDLEGRG